MKKFSFLLLIIVTCLTMLSFEPFSKPKLPISVPDGTVINFWSSNNSESRRLNVKLNNYCKENNINFISISFDEYKSVAVKIAENDGIKDVICVTDGFNSNIAKSLKIVKYQYFIVIENKLIGYDNLGVKKVYKKC